MFHSYGPLRTIATYRQDWPQFSRPPSSPRSSYSSQSGHSIVSMTAPNIRNSLRYMLTVSANLVGTISVSAGQRIVMRAMFYMVVFVAGIGLVAAGAFLYAFGAFSQGTRRGESVADGSIYIAILLLAIVINVAITSPALLLLQPSRLRRVLRAERAAKSPRQRFRGMVFIEYTCCP